MGWSARNLPHALFQGLSKVVITSVPPLSTWSLSGAKAQLCSHLYLPQLLVDLRSCVVPICGVYWDSSSIPTLGASVWSVIASCGHHDVSALWRRGGSKCPCTCWEQILQANLRELHGWERQLKPREIWRDGAYTVFTPYLVLGWNHSGSLWSGWGWPCP